MKRLIAIIAGITALGATVCGLALPAQAEPEPKVTICHAAGREGTTHYVTLTISENAVYKEQGGHFFENGTPRAGHEQDYFGECTEVPTSTPTNTPSPAPTLTSTPTNTPTSTATASPTATSTSTATPPPSTSTPTSTLTATSTATVTNTPAVPSTTTTVTPPTSTPVLVVVPPVRTVNVPFLVPETTFAPPVVAPKDVITGTPPVLSPPRSGDGGLVN
jgi:hypothetical protein